MKRLISTLLSAVMLLSAIPATTAFAEETKVEPETSVIEAKIDETRLQSDEALWEAMWEQYYTEHPEDWEAANTPNPETRTPQTDTTLSAMRRRAEAIVGYQWKPSQNISTWNENKYNGKTYFSSGSTVTGVPYTLFTWEFGVQSLCSLAEYKTVASKNYSSTKYCNAVDETRTGPVYGSCCADLVSEVFGGNYMNGDKTKIHSVSGHWNSQFGTTVKNQKMSDIRPGDAVSDTNHQHIIWVGDVTDSTIMIYEQTPPVAVKKILNKADYRDANGYFIYGGAQYSVITRSNEFVNDANAKPGKPSLKNFAQAYKHGDTIVFNWNNTANTTHYNLYIDKQNANGSWQTNYWYQHYAESGLSLKLTDGTYRVKLQSTNSAVTGSDWPYTNADIITFTVGFVDIFESDSFFNAVMWGLDNHVTAGVNDTHFGPNTTCTRGQIMTVLWRANGSPEPTQTSSPFSDVKSGAFYYKAVLWAVENGITGGTDPTHFSPNQTVSRSEVLQFLYAAKGRPGYTISNPYSDVKKQWFKDCAIWAYEIGLERGENGLFNAATECTRASMITYLYKLYK